MDAQFNRPIRLALLGAGIFARDAHLPALQGLEDVFEVTAIWSRSEGSARALAERVNHPVTLYTDMEALLASPDIEAVDVILPIGVQPVVIAAALAAGKHVLSEKPMAPDVATGRQLLEVYARYPGLIWDVAENWRYSPAIMRSAELIASQEIGRAYLLNWALHIPVTTENKYYHTSWRRDGSFPGGFLLDAGVHHMAALRMLLGEVTEVSAMISSVREDLPPADTLTATLRFASGALANYTVTYAARTAWPDPITVVGDAGALQITVAEKVEFFHGDTVRVLEPAGPDSISAEMGAFAAAIRGRGVRRNTPQEALRDVALMEALLQSAERGTKVTPEVI